MQSSLEQAYSAIERSYGEGRFEEALEQALALQPQLASERSDRLDQRLQLLIGHIHLYGLAQPEQAATAYEALLKQASEAGIRELAEQSLQRCHEQRATAVQPAGITTPPDESLSLGAQPGDQPATPWLNQLHEPDQALAAIQQARAGVTATPRPEPAEASGTSQAAAPWENTEPPQPAPQATPDPVQEPPVEPEATPPAEPAAPAVDPGLLLVKLSSRGPVEASAPPAPLHLEQQAQPAAVKLTAPSLGAAWTLFRRYWRTYLSLEALVLAAALLGALLQLIGSRLQNLAEVNPLLALAPGLALLVAAVAVNLWSNLLGVSLQMVPALAFQHGEHPSAGAMLALLRRDFWRYVRAGLVVGTATSIGLLLLIVPGVLVMIATPVVVRRITCYREKAWPAVLASVKEVSNGTAGAGLLKWQLIAGLLVLASLLLCGLPLLITVPLGGILIQHYLAWSGLGVSPQPPSGGDGCGR